MLNNRFKTKTIMSKPLNIPSCLNQCMLTGVYEMMLLKVRELREALSADITLEGPLARVCPEVHLEVRQLTEGLAAHIALVVHFTVLLLERIRQRPVAPRALRIWAERAALRTAMVVWRQRARRGVSVERRRVGVDGEAGMVAQVKIVRAGDQRLVAVHLHGRRGGQLVAATGRLQPPAVRPLVDDVTTRRGRVGGAVDGQGRNVVMQ